MQLNGTLLHLGIIYSTIYIFSREEHGLLSNLSFSRPRRNSHYEYTPESRRRCSTTRRRICSHSTRCHDGAQRWNGFLPPAGRNVPAQSRIDISSTTSRDDAPNDGANSPAHAYATSTNDAAGRSWTYASPSRHAIDAALPFAYPTNADGCNPCSWSPADGYAACDADGGSACDVRSSTKLCPAWLCSVPFFSSCLSESSCCC